MQKEKVDLLSKHELLDPSIYNESDDDNDDEIDNDNTKQDLTNSFEFSDSYNVMRFMKLIFYLQIMAIIMDNPSFQIPVLFRILCRGILIYASNFYSRPFLDVIYIVKKFFVAIVKAINDVPTIEISNPRKLNSNGFNNLYIYIIFYCIFNLNKFIK
jgi:hypothetical protein